MFRVDLFAFNTVISEINRFGCPKSKPYPNVSRSGGRHSQVPVFCWRYGWNSRSCQHHQASPRASRKISVATTICGPATPEAAMRHDPSRDRSDRARRSCCAGPDLAADRVPKLGGGRRRNNLPSVFLIPLLKIQDSPRGKSASILSVRKGRMAGQTDPSRRVQVAAATRRLFSAFKSCSTCAITSMGGRPGGIGG